MTSARCRPPSPRSGFTLIEMMLVLLIGALLLATAVPFLHGMLMRQRLLSATDAFVHGASLTRAHAQRERRRASMVPLDGRHWQSGWRIEVERQPVWHQDALPPGISVTHTSGGDTLSFQPGGQASTSGTWRFVGNGMTRLVVINFLGRIRSCDPAIDTACGSS